LNPELNARVENIYLNFRPYCWISEPISHDFISISPNSGVR